MATFRKLYLAAVESPGSSELQQLIKDGLEINAQDSMGRTVLHHAVEHGKTDVIQTLVQAGADVTAKDKQGWTPLAYAQSTNMGQRMNTALSQDPSFWFGVVNQMQAAYKLNFLIEQKKIELINCLVKLGADVNAKYGVTTSLHEAIRQNNVPIARVLTKLGLVSATRVSGLTALHQAFDHHHLQVFEHLVSMGVKINACSDKTPAIHDAVASGNEHLVRILVEGGADLCSTKISNLSPLLSAMNAMMPNVNTFGCLVKLGANFDLKCTFSDVVMEAITLGDPAILEYLLSKGAKTRGPNSTVSPLGTAVMRQDGGLVEFLLAHGADINATALILESPLSNAILRGDGLLVETLLKYGDNPNYGFYCKGRLNPLEQAFIYDRFQIRNQMSRSVFKLVVSKGAVVNRRIGYTYPIHIAVEMGDVNMVKLLHRLGADISHHRHEGMTLINLAISPNVDIGEGLTDVPDQLDFENVDMDVVEILVEAGSDLSLTFNDQITPILDAARLQNIPMVKTLVSLGANVNDCKTMKRSVLQAAVTLRRYDILEYLLQHGAKIRSECSLGDTPLHEAISQEDTDMILCLLQCGANIDSKRMDRFSALNQAVLEEDNTALDILLANGADVNSFTNAVGALFEMSEQLPNQSLELVLRNYVRPLTGCPFGIIDRFGISLLYSAVEIGNVDVIETILLNGATTDTGGLVQVFTIVEVLKKMGIESDSDLFHESECMKNLMHSHRKYMEFLPSPLQMACWSGEMDVARLLINAGCDVHVRDSYNNRPLDYLILAKNTYPHVLREIVTTGKATEEVNFNFSPAAHCQNIRSLLFTTGLGDVKNIAYPQCVNLMEQVKVLLTFIISQCKQYSKAKLIPCGSSAEGTKVGWPNEMDFLLALEADESRVKIAGHDYAYYIDESSALLNGGSKKFHSILDTDFGTVIAKTKVDRCGDLQIQHHKVMFQADANRRATSPLHMRWVGPPNVGNFYISVDRVPCLHIRSWPRGGITKTWLLDKDALAQHGYMLVPKPPHIKSPLAKAYTTTELKSLWKLSFAHLETYHMQHLDKRVKDVYLLAKCLRNPDVSRIMISDGGPFPKNVEKYITSYMLKMIFFKNVQHFMNSSLSLGEMVCQVYNGVEEGLSDGFIPLYFMPNVSALGGHKLNVPKCAKVAKVMRRFVHALYLRDCQVDPLHQDEEVEVLVYQRKPKSVYKVVNIS